jgi:hypothetical protein
VSDQPLLGRHDAVPRRRWRWLLPALVLVAVAALVGALVVRLVGTDENGGAKAALNAYLVALERADTEAAYGLLCANESKPSLQEFEAVAEREREDFGGVVRHRIGAVERRSATLVVATYTVQFKRTYKWVAAAIVHENDTWKLCGFRTIPRPEVRVPAGDIPVPPGFVDTETTTATR